MSVKVLKVILVRKYEGVVFVNSKIEDASGRFYPDTDARY